MDNGQFKESASAAKYYVDPVDIDKEFPTTWSVPLLHARILWRMRYGYGN